MAAPDPHDSDARAIFRLLCHLMASGSTALLLVRLQTEATAAEYGILMGLIAFAPTLWLLARTGRVPLDRLTFWALTPIVLAAQGMHATRPTSHFALTYLGTLVVFGALLLPIRTFTGFGALVVVGTGVSRTLRHLRGLEHDPLGLGLVHVLGGTLAFVVATALLQRHHDRVVKYLADATADARREAATAFEASLAKTRFLANMHHELRTPLNAILGYTELLLDVHRLPDVQQGLHAIHTAGTHLLQQVHDVLDTARSEALGEGGELGADSFRSDSSEPALVHRAPSLVSDAIRAQLRVGAGLFTTFAAVAGALAALAATGPLTWTPIVATVAVGLTVVATARRAPALSEGTLLLGCTGVIAHATATIPEAHDLEFYGYFLVAMCALLLPSRRFGLATALITAMLFLAAVGRVANGFASVAEAAIPWIAHLLVVVPLWMVVSRRDRLVCARTARLDEAQRSRRHARRAEQARTAFLSRVSHEIRTPLTTIIGNAEALDDDLTGPDDRADLARIRAAGRHLQGILDDVLDMATFEQGEQPLRLETVDPHSVCRDATHLVQPLLDGSGNRLDLDLQPCPPLSVDARRITQVLVNLLGNAAKFTRDGTIRLSAHTDGQEVVLAVQDEGPGIPLEQQARLFQPFERLDAATSIAGTGLGLAIAQRLVQQHGGRLELESQPGHGATFRIRLPAG